MSIPIKDDVEDFNRTVRSMEVLGFKPLEQVCARAYGSVCVCVCG